MKKVIILLLLNLLIIPNLFSENMITYTIKKGDTLYAVSKRFNIKLDSLKAYNDFSDSTIIFPGMKVKIPGGYTVKKGDTMYSIARENNVDVKELLDLNNMNMDVLLKVGQFIHLPVEKSNNIGKTVEIAKPDLTKDSLSEDTVWPHSGARKELTGKLKGIQIKGNPGDPIVAVNNGRVVWAAEYGIFKKLILIESNTGIVYGYGGNDSTKVKVGDYVTPGSIIGKLGGTIENAEAFFFVYKNGKPLDPEKAPRI